jgi:hypothetical protein
MTQLFFTSLLVKVYLNIGGESMQKTKKPFILFQKNGLFSLHIVIH